MLVLKLVKNKKNRQQQIRYATRGPDTDRKAEAKPCEGGESTRCGMSALRQKGLQIKARWVWFDASVDVNAAGWNRIGCSAEKSGGGAEAGGSQGIGWWSRGRPEIPCWSLSMQLAKRHAALAGGWRLRPTLGED